MLRRWPKVTLSILCACLLQSILYDTRNLPDAHAAEVDPSDRYLFATYYQAIRAGYEFAAACAAAIKFGENRPTDVKPEFILKCDDFKNQISRHSKFDETLMRALGWWYLEWFIAAEEASNIEENIKNPPNKELAGTLTNDEFRRSLTNLAAAKRGVADVMYDRLQIVRSTTNIYAPIPSDQLCNLVTDGGNCERQRRLLFRWREKVKDCILAPCWEAEKSLSPTVSGYNQIRILQHLDFKGGFGAARIIEGYPLAETYPPSTDGRRYCGIILVNDQGEEKFDAQSGKLREACIAYDGRSVRLSSVRREIQADIIKFYERR